MFRFLRFSRKFLLVQSRDSAFDGCQNECQFSKFRFVFFLFLLNSLFSIKHHHHLRTFVQHTVKPVCFGSRGRHYREDRSTTERTSWEAKSNRKRGIKKMIVNLHALFPRGLCEVKSRSFFSTIFHLFIAQKLQSKKSSPLVSKIGFLRKRNSEREMKKKRH